MNDLVLIDVDRIRDVAWPACVKILDEATKKMDDEMEKAAPSDGSYKLVSLIMLHEVFLRKTVAAVVGRDDDDDLLGWIKQELDDWDK